MFSVTTIASSTTNPVAMVSAISDRLSRLYESRYIAPKVPTSERGTATLGTAVARRLRRNANTTSTTRHTLITSVNCTSETEARMVWLRSCETCTSMEGEIDPASCGSSALTRSITSMMFAPGWRRMMIKTARWWSAQAATRSFSTLSRTRATSCRRTGAPLRLQDVARVLDSVENERV